jgi:hypothetical protein
MIDSFPQIQIRETARYLSFTAYCAYQDHTCCFSLTPMRTSGSKRNWLSLSKAFVRDLGRPVYILVSKGIASIQQLEDLISPSRIYETTALHHNSVP